MLNNGSEGNGPTPAANVGTMTYLNTNTTHSKWIVDSGATNHITSSSELLHNYKRSQIMRRILFIYLQVVRHRLLIVTSHMSSQINLYLMSYFSQILSVICCCLKTNQEITIFNDFFFSFLYISGSLHWHGEGN